MKKKTLCILIAALFVFAVMLPAAVSAEDAGKVNINTATVEQLSTLKGIGPAYAQRIIEHRNQAGAFKTPEDIKQVKGVGEKIYEANKDKITVEKPQ